MDHNSDHRNDAVIEERMQLAMERLRELPGDTGVPEPFHDFFLTAGTFLNRALMCRAELKNGAFRNRTLEEMRAAQESLYTDFLPEHYEDSWLNPGAAVRKCGKILPDGTEYGRLLSALYAELYALPHFIFTQSDADTAPILELFLEIYGMFTAGNVPKASAIRDAFYWYAFDYLDVTVPERTAARLIPAESVQEELYRGFAPDDLRYLFSSGDYISEETLRTARFVNALPEEKAEKAALALVEGFEEGFRVMGRDLTKKKTVEIRYTRGFERLVLLEAGFFEKRDGIRVILPGPAARLSDRIPGRGGQQLSMSPNRQYAFDHRFDAAVFWDKAYTDRKISELTASYENLRDAAALAAGPAVMEYFGEAPFTPLLKPEACTFSAKQQKLLNRYLTAVTNLADRYMPGDETSFSIISWPVPAIGPRYAEIFDRILRINTLDNARWKKLQQNIIDVLDSCDHAEITGADGNETHLRISLKKLGDPSKETRFENCASDVNIPAGEVFTSPVLAGTEGLLHVRQVYIDGILFRDLRVRFRDGRTADVSCGNFKTAEENRRFAVENLMGSHDELPLGEFAIGTNTEAYAAAEEFGIWDRLPILIAEKTGPHFALGDTCYSHEEDTMTYNPDGKAIVARDNEISARRHEDPAAAYFGFHMDITLPYDEIGAVTAVMADGSRVDILRDGRFSLPSLEAFNVPLDRLRDRKEKK